MRTPRQKPSTIAGMARRSVPPPKAPIPMRPWSIRNFQLPTMTAQSKGNEARDAKGAFHLSHDGRDAETEDQVDKGAGREGFKGPGRVRLDLTGHEGQLGDADGQCQR